MDKIYAGFIELLTKGEPIVVFLFLGGILFLGWLLGKGTRKAGEKAQSLFRLRRKPASSKELLE